MTSPSPTIEAPHMGERLTIDGEARRRVEEQAGEPIPDEVLGGQPLAERVLMMCEEAPTMSPGKHGSKIHLPPSASRRDVMNAGWIIGVGHFTGEHLAAATGSYDPRDYLGLRAFWGLYNGVGCLVDPYKDELYKTKFMWIQERDLVAVWREA